MKIYWYKTNGGDGLLLAHRSKWIDIYGGDIDGMAVCEENAKKHADAFRAAWKDGGFTEIDFNDWYNDAKCRSNPPKYTNSGTNPKKFLENCESYVEL